MSIRNPKREELRRLESKTLDAQFKTAIQDGLNCSPFEAEAVLGVVREVYFPFMEPAAGGAARGAVSVGDRGLLRWATRPCNQAGNGRCAVTLSGVAGTNIHWAPVSACGSGPCRPSLSLTERSEWATADRVRRGRGLRTGSPRLELRGANPGIGRLRNLA
jgi:hypothetical protein